MLGKNIATNFAFNTAFFSDHINMVEGDLKELSPLSSVKSGLFQPNFKIRIYFKKVCECTKGTELNKRCEGCKKYLKGQTLSNW